MSEIEFGNAIFRGTLYGANGEIQAGLSVGAIDAVKRINIKDGSLSASAMVVVRATKTLVNPYPGQYSWVEINRFSFNVYEDNTLLEMFCDSSGIPDDPSQPCIAIDGRVFAYTSISGILSGESIGQQPYSALSGMYGILNAGTYHFIDTEILQPAEATRVVNFKRAYFFRLINEGGFAIE